MDLHGLPQFTVTVVRPSSADGVTEVVGELSHVRGVHNAGGYLYRPSGSSIAGDLDSVPRQPGVAIVFRTPDAGLAPELAPGVVYPWLDHYWQPYHLRMILAGPETWHQRVFVATPAHYFRQAGVLGWQPAGEALPADVEDLGVRSGAWDHEHCELCRTAIGIGGGATGYVNADELWLCPACFQRYATVRDVSFAAEQPGT